MQKELGWNEIDYSNIIFAFQIAYAAGQFLTGRMMDLFGVRLGYAVAVAAWRRIRFSHTSHGAVGSFSRSVCTVPRIVHAQNQCFARGFTI